MHVMRKISYISIVLIGGLVLFALGRYSALRQTTTCGLTLSVATAKRTYALGDPLPVSVTYRNNTLHTMEFWNWGDDLHFFEMRMVLYDASGRSVAKTARHRMAEQRLWHGNAFFNRIYHLRPGGTYTRSVNLKDWFDITTPGIYHLVICQSNNIRWREDISVSNPVLIQIGAPKGPLER